MRDIIFRGKCIDNNGRWVYGSYIFSPGSHMIREHKDMSRTWSVIPETVGQFTGFIRNDEIYEGDICDTHTRLGKCVVKFESGMFKINGLSLCTFAGKLEVIGNIHDHRNMVGGEVY